MFVYATPKTYASAVPILCRDSASVANMSIKQLQNNSIYFYVSLSGRRIRDPRMGCQQPHSGLVTKC
jgi:hypothetical protein